MTVSITATAAPAPLAVYEAILRDAADGRRAALTIVDDAGRVRRVDPRRWCGGLVDGDAALLDRCSGPTLDIGCGPGRLSAALSAGGHPALGVDISAVAVGLARERGAAALRRDVFDPLPGEGRWRHVLLADGNIGISGDPLRLLRRCRQLIRATGRIHVELHAPPVVVWRGHVRLATPRGAASRPFPWAYVGAAGIAALAGAAALRTLAIWTEARRWFACLTPG